VHTLRMPGPPKHSLGSLGRLRSRGGGSRSHRTARPQAAPLAALSDSPHPLRIALAIERFDPRAGGAERVAWKTAQGLAAAGDDVHVFAREAAHCLGVETHRVKAPRLWQPLRVGAFSYAVGKATSSAEFDLVYSLARTARQNVYRAGAGCHEDFLEKRYEGAARQLRRISPRHRTLIALERSVFADPAQLVICNSEMVKREIQARYGVPARRLALIRNGVHLDRDSEEQRANLRKRLRAKWGEAATIWLFAGHDLERKGFDTALHALVTSQEQESLLWVAGGDDPAPWQPLIRRLGLEARVRFLGKRRDLRDVFAAVDGLILPSRYDAFANVCLEAAAAGIPVLTSTANGAGELFASLSTGVFPSDDVAGFARALDALSDAETRKRAGAEARFMAERHGWERHIASIREAFLSWLSRKSSANETSSKSLALARPDPTRT